MSESFYKRMFFVGALWNLLGGLAIAFGTGLIFGTSKLTTPEPPIFYHSWIALFMTFGIGYWIVSRDLYGNHNIVILGIVGKMAFSVIFVVEFFAFKGELPPLLWIPVIGDLTFVVLFWMFLRFSRGHTRAE